MDGHPFTLLPAILMFTAISLVKKGDMLWPGEHPGSSSLHRISATSAYIRSTWRDIERHLELHASRSNIPRPRDIPSNGNIIYWKCGKQRLIFCHFTVAVFSFVLVEKMLCVFVGSLSPLFAPLESGLLQHYQHQASVRTFTQLLQPQAWIILSWILV